MKLHYILSRTLCSGLCGEWNILHVSFKRTFSALSSNAVLINQEVDKFDVANKSNVAPLQKDSIDWKWQSSKTVVQCKYKNGKGMLPVEVNVFDNHLGSDAPTVVMLLGLSGSGDDFKDMVTFLSSAGIRCVAPEIPGNVKLCIICICIIVCKIDDGHCGFWSRYEHKRKIVGVKYL